MTQFRYTVARLFNLVVGHTPMQDAAERIDLEGILLTLCLTFDLTLERTHIGELYTQLNRRGIRRYTDYQRMARVVYARNPRQAAWALMLALGDISENRNRFFLERRDGKRFYKWVHSPRRD